MIFSSDVGRGVRPGLDEHTKGLLERAAGGQIHEWGNVLVIISKYDVDKFDVSQSKYEFKLKVKQSGSDNKKTGRSKKGVPDLQQGGGGQSEDPVQVLEGSDTG